MTLGFKLGRRLMAVAAVDDEHLAYHDARFVPSRRAVLASAASRYFARILDQLTPTAVYYYAPTGPHTVTEALVRVLEAEAATRGIPAKALARSEVFGSFGVLPFKTREDLRDQLHAFWPALREDARSRQVVLAEAAAVALIGDVYQEWPPV